MTNNSDNFSLLTEEMIHGLQQLGWKKVDVSFHSAFWPFFAHNNIHVLIVAFFVIFLNINSFILISDFIIVIYSGEKRMASQRWCGGGCSCC